MVEFEWKTYEIENTLVSYVLIETYKYTGTSKIIVCTIIIKYTMLLSNTCTKRRFYAPVILVRITGA